MKLIVFSSLIACTAAFSQKDTSRRDAMAGIAAAGAALVPTIANAAAGESPRFSVFGLLGDGTSYSEGGAYGSDQSSPVYSPYSVYGKAGADSLYKPDAPEYRAKQKLVLVETAVRLKKLDKYADKKQWTEVNQELTRYVYSTREAIAYLAKTPKEKKLATTFFKNIEATAGAATQKKQEPLKAAIARSIESFDELNAVLK